MFILGLTKLLIGFPGPMELIIIFFIVLLLFGANKMPEIARSLGKGMKEFKRASNEIRGGFDESTKINPPKKTAAEKSEDEEEKKEEESGSEPSTPSIEEEDDKEPETGKSE